MLYLNRYTSNLEIEYRRKENERITNRLLQKWTI